MIGLTRSIHAIVSTVLLIQGPTYASDSYKVREKSPSDPPSTLDTLFFLNVLFCPYLELYQVSTE